MTGIEALRKEFPFDQANQEFRRIGDDGLPQGWSCGEMVKAMREHAKDAKVVIDGGSFQGRSATHFLREAPNSMVICIDHWKGSEEHQKREDVCDLYEIFLANMEPFRDRIIPVRASSIKGMNLVKWCNIKPDVILIDWAHDKESVYNDVYTAMMLFPGATLILDDWRRQAVRDGAYKAMAGFSHVIECGDKIAVVRRYQ
jgi:hypothetical protein